MSDLMPIGPLTYSIACYHCKHREGGDEKRCRQCKCEVESGVEYDSSTFPTNDGDLISRSTLLERLRYKRDYYRLYQKSTYPGLESAIAQVKKAPTVDAVPVEKLGNLGKYMMPYTGDPRGHMGMPGIFDPQKDALMMDTFEDVDGSVWRPVLEPVLQELLRRVNAMQVVRCKNCKQYDESETGSDCGLHVCRFHTDMSGGKKALFVEPMDFCSYGERKDDGKV